MKQARSVAVNSVDSLLVALPKRGWSLVECEPLPVVAGCMAGLVKAHATPQRGAYHVRLTGHGRKRQAALKR